MIEVMGNCPLFSARKRPREADENVAFFREMFHKRANFPLLN
jgi:hypothetical protein